jgi:hypothetical protein
VSSNNRLSNLIGELASLETDIEMLETRINKMKAKAAMLATVDIPEAMTELGSSSFTTDNYLKCEVGYKIYGSLPGRDNPDARFAAIDYLKAHEGGELIKSKVELVFAKGDIRAANRTKRYLEKQIRTGIITGEHEPVVEVDNEVHPMSLQAWGRARVAENKPIDLAIVGLRGQTKATVKNVAPK